MSNSALGYLRRQYLCVLRRCAWLNAAASCALLALPVGSVGAQGIVADGRTQTQVNVNGAVTDITTGTIRGNNAFNSFSTFNVDAGNTVNLHLPGQTSNLLNLVHGEQSYINGLVNAYQDGRIGGNVFFYNPHGVIVGSAGVLNVGSLTLATPTTAYMDSLISPTGSIGDEALALALNGQVPLSQSGLVLVRGRINALNAIDLAAADVNVAAGGQVLAGGSAQVSFSDLVNIQGARQAASVSVAGGTIRILADNDIEVAGQVSADGRGTHANGGSVTVMAGHHASLQTGGKVSADGGKTGDGGFVEFSAKDTVALAGGSLSAAAKLGQAGSVLIDPANLLISADLLRDTSGNASSEGMTWNAGSLTLQADDQLTLADGVVISTRQVGTQTRAGHINGTSTGDSGNLTLKAAHIDLGTDAQLLAQADSGFQGGDVLVQASHINAQGALRTADASISGTHVTIRGRDITLTAIADTSLLSQLLAQAPNTTLADAQAYINSELDDPIDGVAGQLLQVTTTATATTELYGANIQGSGDVSVSAFAGARSGFEKIATAEVVIGDQLATDGVTVLARSDLHGQTLNISSTADTSLTYNVLGTVQRLTDSSWLPGEDSGELQLLNDQLFDFSSVPLVSLSTSTAHTTISGDSQLRGDDTLSVTSSATSAAKPTFAGLVVLSAGWGESTAEAKTLVGGSSDLYSGNQTEVSAATDVEVNVTATVNSTNKPIDIVFVRAKSTTTTTAEVGAGVVIDAGSLAVDASTKADISASADAQNTGGSGVGLAVAVNESTNITTATLGGDATARTGNLDVTAEIDIAKNSTGANAATLGKPGMLAQKITNPMAKMQSQASSSILSSTGLLSNKNATALGDYLFPGVKEGKFNVSGAVAYADASNTATASIAPLAHAKAQGNLAVTSNIKDRPDASVGAKSTSTGTSLGGSVIIANFDNYADAYLGRGSTVDAKGALLVDAQTLVPYPWQINWNSPAEILNHLQGSLLDLGLTSYAINAASGESGLGLSVAVSVFGINNNANAWIDEGAKVNTVYDKNTQILPLQSVAVTAKNDLNSVNAVGILSKKFLGTKGGKAAVGGSANVMQIETNASATIRGNAEVRSENGATVKAENIDHLVTVTEAGGQGGQVGVEGAVSVNIIDATAIAAVDDDAHIDLGGDLDITANNTVQDIAVAGGVVVTKGQVGIGFSVSINDVDTEADAYIGDYDPAGLDNVAATGEVKTAGDINVKAISNTEIGAYSVTGAIATDSKAQTEVPANADETQANAGSASSAGGAAKGKFGIAVSADASINDIHSDTLAYIADGAKISQANDVLVDASNTLAINALAGAVTISTQSNGNGLAGSYAQNSMVGTTAAYLDDADLTLSGGLDLNAAVDGEINSLSASVQGSKGKIGVAGSVSVNSIANTTQAYAQSSQLNTVAARALSANLLARDTSAIHSVAGAVAFGGKAGVGLAFAWNKLDNSSQAYVDLSDLYVSGDLGIEAGSDNDIQTIAAAIGASQNGMAASGAVSVNTIGNTASAHMTNSTLDSSTGEVRFKADDQSDIFAISGNAAVSGGQASLGVSVSYNEIDNLTEARTTGGTLKGANVSLTANENADMQVIAAGGGGSAKVAVTGSLGINLINNQTRAKTTNTGIESAGLLTVKATDSSQMLSISGAIGAAGNAAVGAAGSYNHIGNIVDAEVSGGIVNVGEAWVDAERASAMEVWAVAGSAAGTAGFAGSIALNDIGGVTTARVGEGAQLTADGNVRITAQGDDRIDSRAGAVAASGTVGGAGSIAFNDIHTDTLAQVSGVGTQVTGKANGAAARVDNGQLSALTGLPSSNPLADRQLQDDLQGVAVVASSTSQVENFVISASVSGSAGLAGTLSVAMLTGYTSAEVTDGASLNTTLGDLDQQARVAAYHHDNFASGSGAGAISGDVGIGGAMDTLIDSHVTTAQVKDASAQAQQAVTVEAGSTTEIAQAVIGLGGGTYVGLSGSIGLILLDSTTQAIADNADLDSQGSLSLSADSEVDTAVAAGAVAVSGVAGIGLTGTAAIYQQSTQALVKNGAALNADGLTTVDAHSDLDHETYAATAAAAGAVGVAGTINAVVVKGSTQAVVDGTSALNADATFGGAAQDVNLAATDRTVIDDKVGGLGVGLGGVGVGAAVDVALINNGVTARIDAGADIHADRDISVSARSQRDVTNVVVAAAGGMTSGISGAVSVISIGARPDADAGSESGGSIGEVARLVSADAFGSQMDSDEGGTSASRDRANAARANTDVAADMNASHVNSTAAATVAGSLDAGRDVAVSAHNTSDVDATAVGVAVSGGLSIGGGVALAFIDDQSVASLTGDTTAVRNVSVTALDDQTDVALLTTYAGGGGLVGLGASVAILEKSSTADAELGGTLNTGGAVTVDAGIDHHLDAEGLGVAAGLAGVGAAIAHAEESGAARASLANAADITAGSLDVHGHGQTDTVANVTAAAGGLISGAGAEGVARDLSAASAKLGDNVIIHTLSGLTQVRAESDPYAQADALGVSVSASVSIGVSIADATVNTRTEASTGQRTDITAADFSLRAESKQRSGGMTADAYAKAGVGGLLLGASATEANSTVTTTTLALLGDDALLDIGHDLNIEAASASYANTDVTGVNVGLLAGGSNQATTRTTSTTQAGVGDNADLTADNLLKIDAHSYDTLRANTESGSGGLGSLVASKATTDAEAHTDASLGTATGTTGLVNAKRFEMDARSANDINATASSINASVAGFSGARAVHNVDNYTHVTLGPLVTVNAEQFVLRAENLITKPALGSGHYNVDSGSGGLLDAAAANSTSRLNNTASVDLGAGDVINVNVVDTPVLPNLLQGELDILVFNQVDASDSVRLDSGGAIAIAKSESMLHSDHNSAAVNIGDGAQLYSDGDINLSARADVVLDANARSKTYGLAGASQGASAASIGVDNQVNIGANALVESEGENVNLLAGSDGTNANRLIANADTRLWNYTALPVENDPDADASVIQHNSIDVAAGSQVNAVKSVYLTATEGSHSAHGYGEGTDAYRETLSAIGEFFGADTSSLKITGGSSYDNAGNALDAASGVNVDGAVHAGIHHLQYLTLDTDGVTVLQQSDGVSYTLEDNVLLASLLQAEIDAIRAKAQATRAAASDYAGDNTAADAALALDNDADILEAQLAALNSNARVGFLHVGPVTALTGDVRVSGRYLTGNGGVLDAPGDVRIDIVNRSTRFMTTDTLTIPDGQGGQVTFNGLSVSGTAAINQRNALGHTASNMTVLNADTTPKPVISVKNTNGNDTTTGQPAQLWMLGDVTNLRGVAEANSQGTLRVSANIDAETVNIATGGDFIKTWTPGFTHQGGNPISRLGSVPGANESATYPYTNLNPIGQSTSYWDSFYSNSAGLDKTGADPGCAAVACGSTIAGNNVYISAEKLNINGLIQAGLPDRLQTIDANLLSAVNPDAAAHSLTTSNSAAIAALKSKWANGDHSQQFLDLNEPAAGSSAIRVSYDAANDRLQLDNVRMGGGHLELFGNIFSTGNGQLNVMDGYGRINVNNTTGYDLAVGRVDTGAGVEGVIKITDTAKRVVNGVVNATGTGTGGVPLVTQITRVGNSIQTSTNATSNGSMTTPVESATGRVTSYNPTANRRFNWINGRKTVNTWTDVYIDNGYRAIPGVTCGFCVADNDVDPAATTVTSPSTRLAGDWLSTGESSALSDYVFDYTRYTTAKVRITDSHTVTESPIYDSFGTLWGYKVSDNHTVQDQWTVYDYYHHSLNASKSIGINFTGYDSASISLASNGQLLLGDLTRAVNGTTTLTGNTGIQSLNDDAHIVANNLVMTSTAGAIGSSTQSINIDLVDDGSALGKVSANGLLGVALKEIDGDLRVAQARSDNGDVSLIADRNLLADSTSVVVTGNNLNLVSLSGQIGDALDPLKIETLGTTSTLSASAAGDIHLAEQSGDLRVVEVRSAAGDVGLSAPGSLLDANTVETVDTKTQAELLALWDEMALRNSGAEQALDRSLQAQQNGLKQSYEQYFRMRNLHRNDDGSYSAAAYDPNYTYHATANQTAALKAANGWSDADVTAYEAGQTAAYHAAYTRFGGGAYVENFTPTLTADETTALSAGAKWTDAQLANAISAGLLREVADTNIRLEDPNVIGQNVTLLAGAGIGSNLSDVVIIKGTDFDQLSDAEKLALLTAERNDVSVSDTAITIRRHEDFNLTASGALTASAQGDIHLGSEQNLQIDSVQTPGEARIKTGAALSAVAGQTNVSASEIVLEAANGDLGSATTAMRVDVGSGRLSARAGGSLYVEEASGDMVLAGVFARGEATLITPGAIIEGNTDRLIDIRADNIHLTAGDTIGQAGTNRSLDVAVDANGVVDASAPNGIYLNSTGGSGGLGSVSTTGRFDFSVDQGSMDIVGVISADAGISLGAADDLNFAGGKVVSLGDIELQAGSDGSGSVLGNAGNGPDVDAGGTVTVVAANDIGGADPLQIKTATQATLRATNIDAELSPQNDGAPLSVVVTGPNGDLVLDANLNFIDVGDVTLPTFIVHNGVVRTDGPTLAVEQGYLGDAVTFHTPDFSARIDHLVRSMTPGLDARAFTLNNDFSLRITPSTLQLDDLIINQNLRRNVYGSGPGVADVLSTQSLQTLQQQLPGQQPGLPPQTPAEQGAQLVNLDLLSLADVLTPPAQ
jgi:filamentous hemagglutinin family protein